ncbi:MAG: hypothetical protein ACLQJ7_15675 [Syntrophobacteraceae bacterium]
MNFEARPKEKHGQEAGSREQEAKNRAYFYCPESKIHYISPEYLGRHSGEPCPGSV